MAWRKIALKNLSCDPCGRKVREIRFMKRRFLARCAIPAPVINKNNEVISHASSYFAMLEIGLPYTWAVQYPEHGELKP